MLPWEALSERGPISRSKAGGIYRYNIRPDSVRSAACQSVSLGLNQEVRLEANHTHLLFTELAARTAADAFDDATGSSLDGAAWAAATALRRKLEDHFCDKVTSVTYASSMHHCVVCESLVARAARVPRV